MGGVWGREAFLRPFFYWQSAQPSPTQKGGIDAPFLNCTSEVPQRFLYTNVTLLHKNEWVWGQG
jgi:hypothetical protein